MQTLVIVSWAVSIVIQFLFPVALGVWFARRYGVGGRVFLYGALVFFVAQMLLRTPLLQAVAPKILPWAQSTSGDMTLYLAGLAITAGLFESVGRWAGYRWLFPQGHIPYLWETAVAYGIGHGAAESILLVGVSSALSLIQAVTLTGMTPEALQAAVPEASLEAAQAAQAQYLAMTGLAPIWGGVERILTMALHVALSLIVLQVFTRRQLRWLWVAVGIHALVDFVVPGMVALWGLSVWISEAALAVVAVGCVAYIVLARRAQAPGGALIVAADNET